MSDLKIGLVILLLLLVGVQASFGITKKRENSGKEKKVRLEVVKRPATAKMILTEDDKKTALQSAVKKTQSSKEDGLAKEPKSMGKMDGMDNMDNMDGMSHMHM